MIKELWRRELRLDLLRADYHTPQKFTQTEVSAFSLHAHTALQSPDGAGRAPWERRELRDGEKKMETNEGRLRCSAGRVGARRRRDFFDARGNEDRFENGKKTAKKKRASRC